MEILKQFARLFGYKNRQFETLTEINVDGAKIRIWREASSLEEAQTFDHDALMIQMHNVCTLFPPRYWTAQLMKMPRVACVAIVNAKGNGVSAYPNWG